MWVCSLVRLVLRRCRFNTEHTQFWPRQGYFRILFFFRETLNGLRCNPIIPFRTEFNYNWEEKLCYSNVTRTLCWLWPSSGRKQLTGEGFLRSNGQSIHLQLIIPMIFFSQKEISEKASFKLEKNKTRDWTKKIEFSCDLHNKNNNNHHHNKRPCNGSTKQTPIECMNGTATIGRVEFKFKSNEKRHPLRDVFFLSLFMIRTVIMAVRQYTHQPLIEWPKNTGMQRGKTTTDFGAWVVCLT